MQKLFIVIYKEPNDGAARFSCYIKQPKVVGDFIERKGKLYKDFRIYEVVLCDDPTYAKRAIDNLHTLISKELNKSGLAYRHACSIIELILMQIKAINKI